MNTDVIDRNHNFEFLGKTKTLAETQKQIDKYSTYLSKAILFLEINIG